VRLGRFDRDRSITFIPPDGVFELMTYRISENINLPFKVVPVVQEYPELNKLEYSVKLKAIFERTNFASNVVCKVPVPPNSASVKIYSAGAGKAKYEPEQNAIMWRIKKFQGDQEFLMSAEVIITPLKTDKQWNRPPISLDFQVCMHNPTFLFILLFLDIT
jgi:AP-2 complex subunit mu-1